MYTVLSKQFLTKQSIKLVAVVAVLVSVTMTSIAVASNSQSSMDFQVLYAEYKHHRDALTDSDFDAPIVVTSSSENDTMTGTVFAIVSHPFNQVGKLLESSRNWCEASSLHVNVKSCTVNSGDKSPHTDAELHLYVGQKDYQIPEDAYRFDYHYEITTQSENFIKTRLSADSGPLDTANYRIEIQAIPLDNNSSFVKLSYSAEYGFMSKIMLKTYLATLGRNKVGFTKTGLDENGEPIFIAGIEGIIERNAMRYLLAMRSFLDASSLPHEQQFEAGLKSWFGFTKKYKRQLYELGYKEYMDNKKRERKNQTMLQLAIRDIDASGESLVNPWPEDEDQP